MAPPIHVRHLGRSDYATTWRAMQAYTAARGPDTADELWLTEHPPVYTLGQAGRREHLLRDIGVPVLAVDRGGQVTYHGPGQAVVYVLLDLRRRAYGVKGLVQRLEQAVIDLLAAQGVAAERLAGAPGVYVRRGDGAPAKLAALGLKVRNGCTYHGLALNVDLDLTPFNAINPCGHAGMPVTRLKDLGLATTVEQAAAGLAERLLDLLSA
ncbi:MAG: lipoyl(octanoyl) transferase LipB [Thiobacillaceae bacterium]|nr:lipoyl(octanoyl) transferase LipB [Thiobacillaceae bacterium]MCX7672454.1 lipoyl(octanoyl) transferase LipB [Thiobacillaceae bacterium]MDW8323114.1 lipoyl(octanoyl) transferase LipB [Burkholderiales bacterium]